MRLFTKKTQPKNSVRISIVGTGVNYIGLEGDAAIQEYSNEDYVRFSQGDRTVRVPHRQVESISTRGNVTQRLVSRIGDDS